VVVEAVPEALSVVEAVVGFFFFLCDLWTGVVPSVEVAEDELEGGG
jgi:hypothetical protein